MDNERLKIMHLVREAVLLHRELGEEQALIRISDPDGAFSQGEHYVFVLDVNGNLLSHPHLKELEGRNLIHLRDSTGRKFINDLVSKARSRCNGFSEYKWRVPTSKEERHKTVFFERVGDIVVCGGFYGAEDSPLEALYKRFRPYGPC